MTSHSSPLLLISSVAVLAAVSGVAYLVLGRSLAAFWQLFIFWGYASPGVSLSKSTGWLFLGTVVMLGTTAFVLRKVALRKASFLPARIANIMLVLLLVTVLVYGILGFGPMNHWRA